MSATVDLTELFERQRAARARVAALDHRARGERLARLERALLDRRADLRAALGADLGRPPLEADATELLPVITELRHARRRLRRWTGARRVPTPVSLFGSRSRVVPRPLGTALILAPWNFPVNLTLGPLVSALAAGCTAIVKPSELAPHAAHLVAELLAGVFPDDEVAVVQGGADVAAGLTALPFDKIFFTGSARVGRLVARAAAEHLTPVTLELGGRSPAIVAESADVERAAAAIARGKFTNAGQICIAPDHVLVARSREEALHAALGREVERRYGPGADERRRSADYGRIVSPAHLERLIDLLEDAQERGARVTVGGEHDRADRYLAPTVLRDVPHGAAILQSEIFGPLLPVLAVDDLEEALECAGRDRGPLVLYGFGDARDRRRIAEASTAGATALGATLIHFANPHLPFGGVGPSGHGRSHGRAGFDAFSAPHAQLEVARSAPLAAAVEAPYRGRARRMVDLALRWL